MLDLTDDSGSNSPANAYGLMQLLPSTAERVARGFGDRMLFRDISFALGPGIRLGLLGANGSGKTSLLKILAGEVRPDAGSVEFADALRVVYFDQNREQLEPEVTLRRALAPSGDSVIFQERVIHVASWAKRFLFRQDQLELPVGRLSGGEQARVLIARLMLKPADLLLLDEPTNDLDIPTLEILEESLLEFAGAMVLVTHDRYMLDRVSTVLLALDGTGGAEFFADYAQWEASLTQAPAGAEKKERPADTRAPKPRKLSYKEAREYEKEFPDQLYSEWYRLYQLPRPEKNKPWKFKHLTVNQVYYPLARSSGKILDLVRSQRAKSGEHGKKLHQFLAEIGVKALRTHLGQLLGIAQVSDDKTEYERRVAKIFGTQQSFDFDK